jgi:hypothetical protein
MNKAAPGSNPKKKEDVLFVHGPTKSGEGRHAIRAHDGKISLCEIRSLPEGEPIKGEVVKLRQRSEHPRLFDVDVLMAGEPARPAPVERSGPAQIATDAYRDNWEAIFGGRTKKRPLLN